MEPVIGLDFGTTNSALAVADTRRQATLATGGSSFVPVVRRFFSRTFGAGKLRSGEELTTVAKGLALRALEN
jgi:molecular chaperone DnaK (HSP70)